MLQSFFGRIFDDVFTQKLIVLKRVHEPADKSGVPIVWILSDSDICSSLEIGYKFQPSLILRVIIEDYIANMIGSVIQALWIICQLYMNHCFNIKCKNGAVP